MKKNVHSFINKFYSVILAAVLATVLVASPAFAAIGDVVISEFMADPVTITDANGEWIELENKTSTIIDISGWKLDDGGSATLTFPLTTTIDANGFLVICRNSALADANCDVQWSGMSLANGGDTITLKDTSLEVIDSLEYESSDVTPGASTEVAIEGNGQKVLASNTVDTYTTNNTGTPKAMNALTLPVVNTDTGEEFSSIQAAIDDEDTLDGHTIEVAATTLNESVNVTKEVTIDGAGEGATIIDASSFNDYSIEVRVNNVTLKDFTLIGNASGAAAYGVKVAYVPVGTQLTNFTIQNVTVDGSKRTGIDLNGVVGANISEVTVKNVPTGNGISATDSSNIVIENATTSNNAWGGVALYTEGGFFPAGSNNITVTNLLASEPNPLYVQAPSTTPVTNITAPQFTFIVENDTFRAGGEDYEFYQATRNSAFANAAALPTPQDSRVKQISSGDLFVNTNLSIKTAMDFVESGKAVRAVAGTYPSVVLNDTYDIDIKLIGGVDGESVLESLDLTGSTFDGLQISSFTFKGQTTSYGASSLAINGNGTYKNLKVTGNKFDGDDQQRRAVFINRGFAGLHFNDNDFTNFVDSSPTLYSVVFVEAQGTTMGSNFVANDNSLNNSNLPNFFESYRFSNVEMKNNIVNADRGRLMAWSQPADLIAPVNISNNEINLTGGTGVGVYYATSGTTTISENEINGADNCIVTYDVFDLVVSENKLTNCVQRGSLFETAGYQDLDSATVQSNSVSASPTGFENNNSLFVQTCTNMFSSVTTQYVGSIGCTDVDAPVMTNINMFVNGVDSNLAKAGDTIRVVADVTDDNGVEKVQIWVRDFPYTGQQITSGEMTLVSGNTYEFVFTLPANYQSGTPIQQTFEGNYFNFRPYDTLGNSFIGNRNNFTVDNTKPTGNATYTGDNEVDGVVYVRSIDNLSFTETIEDNHSVVRSTFLVQKLNLSTGVFEGFCGNWNANSLGSNALGGSIEETYTETNVGKCNANQSLWTDGTYKIFHGAYDAAGNEGKYNTNRQIFVIDSTAPNISWQLQPQAVYGSSDGFHVRPITSEVGTVKSVYIDTADSANLCYTKTSDHKNMDTKNTNCQTLWDSLPEGEHKFVAVFTDYAGNTSTSESNSFIIDRTPPTITVKDGFIGDKDAKIFSNVSFKLFDEFKVDKYVLNGQTVDFTNNKWSDANFQNIKSKLVEGLNTFVLYDVAGNSTAYEFTYDSTPPGQVMGVSIFQNNSDLGCYTVTNDRTITVKWADSTDVNFSFYNYQADADKTLPYDFTTIVTSSERSGQIRDLDGTYHYRVQAVDMAGNVGPWSDWCGVTLDRVAPVAGFTTLVTTDTSPELSGTIDDDYATVEVTVNGRTYLVEVLAGIWTMRDKIIPALTVGTYDVTVVSTDMAGNTNSQTFNGRLIIEELPTPTPPESGANGANDEDDLEEEAGGVVAGVNTQRAVAVQVTGTGGGEPFLAQATNEEVLGEDSDGNDTTTSDGSDGEEDGTARVLQSNTDGNIDAAGDTSNQCLKIFGICWYWYIIPALAIIVGYLYYRSRKDVEKQ